VIQRRTKLIDLVIRQGYKIRRASKMLKINESTAKSIVKLFKTTGTYSPKLKPHKDASEFRT
jgi:transposase